MSKKYYAVKEVAEILGLSTRTIWRYIEQEKLNTVDIFGNVRISQEELDRIVAPVDIEIKEGN